MTPADQTSIPQGFKASDGLIIACNGVGLSKMLEAGKYWLEAHVKIVNNMNVFPVPDGDTGTNMLLTMRSVLEKLKDAPDHEVGTIAAAAAQGALMGARGNSGVILSQFLQGIAASLEGRRHFTAEEFAHALSRGAENAYQSVLQPVEGTILTVARAAAEMAQQQAKTEQDLVRLLSEVLKAAKIAQAKTPELLPILKQAGVTDSGGQGLVYILEGALQFLLNEPIASNSGSAGEPESRPGLVGVEEPYGYDVQFLIHGETLDVAKIREHIAAIGRSTLVVGNEHVVKVHVHTPDPGLPLSYGYRQGGLSDIVVENMEEQAKMFAQAPKTAATQSTLSRSDREEVNEAILGGQTAIIAVVPGQGLAEIFQSLGASCIVPGGQTMNPSVQELLEAVNQVQLNDVLIFPNNGNVIMAARQTQALSNKNVFVIPTQTIPEGVAALISFDNETDLQSNVRRMVEAMRHVQTLEIITAARDSNFDGLDIKAGNVIGLLNHNLASAGETEGRVILDALAQVTMEKYEVMTIYAGQGVSADQGQAVARAISGCYPELEIEIHDGGQPHANYIISLE